jgi:hypothetical protein
MWGVKRPVDSHDDLLKCAGPAGIWLPIARKHHPLGPCYIAAITPGLRVVYHRHMDSDSARAGRVQGHSWNGPWS